MVQVLTLEQIKSLNELEISIYNYIMQHKEQALHMKIRELADAVHVSTTTVVRFCKKTGCNGYAEFKIKYRLYLENRDCQDTTSDVSIMVDFFQKINHPAFYTLVKEAAQAIYQCEKIIFTGIGTSGILANYGARFFTNVGKFSFCIDDPFYPVTQGFYEKTIIIALSVTGETKETLEHVQKFKNENCRLISITNKEDCTLSRLADIAFTYYMPSQRVFNFHDITPQVPVIFILETIAKQVYELLKQDADQYVG